MDHRLRVDLLDGPNVDGVIGAKELMRGSLPPAVETPLVIPHEILPGQHGMLLHPDDRLGEVEALGLQDGWVVPTVGIAAPDIKRASRQQYPGNVSEPGCQHLIERLFGHIVIGQRSVLGSQLLMGRFDLRWMPDRIETLVMLEIPIFSCG